MNPLDRPLRVAAGVAMLALLALAGCLVACKDDRPRKRAPLRPTGALDTSPRVGLTEEDFRRTTVILGAPTDRSVLASVLTATDLEVVFEVAPEAGGPSSRTEPARLRPGEPREIAIDGLRPDTRYRYRMLSRASGSGPYAIGEEWSFHTRRRPGSPFRFAIQSDTHLYRWADPDLYRRTLANMAADRPDLVLDLGDAFMNEQGHESSEPETVKRHVEQRHYFGRLCHSAPLFLALGNHEGEHGWPHDPSGNKLATWACRARTSFYPNPVPDGFYTGNARQEEPVGRRENYYAFTWGDALFVVLDPWWYSKKDPARTGDPWDGTLGDEQYRWLATTLRESAAAHKLVFSHYVTGATPRGVGFARQGEWGGLGRDGEDEFAERRPGWPLPVHDLMVRHGVSIFFQGHTHSYTRREIDGIVYQTCPQPANTPYAHEEGDPSTCGHLRVEVSPDEVRVDWIQAYVARDEDEARVNGTVAKSYTIRARR